MKFKPVIKFDKAKYPIWEIDDIEIPDSLYTLIKESNWTKFDKYTKNSEYSQPQTRLVLGDYDRSITKTISDDINEYIFEQEDYDLVYVKKSHPIVAHSIRSIPWRVDPVKDIANYKLGIHTDGIQFIGTAIINVENNNTVTEYFADKDGKELIYKGSGRKGTGVLHLNTPYTYHRVRNTTNEDRYILHCILNNPSLY